ncbi:MAG TPA: DUF3035 domain-containing protein [Geminicoccaceae bacterium]|nr:DUF3035 domain-containing protein [Geminicoccaceae bacterium]
MAILAACGQGSVQNALGMGKRSPDEFAVVSRAPLILPPDYGLRPPRPGESRPGVDTPGEQARASLLGQAPAAPASADQARAAPAGADQEVVSAAFDQTSPVESSGERALVAQATTVPTDPDIRRKIGEENMQLAQVEQDLFTRLVKWREPASLGATIDPAAETQRLRTNRAEGKPATEGESPVITQRRQSVLQGFLSEVF